MRQCRHESQAGGTRLSPCTLPDPLGQPLKYLVEVTAQNLFQPLGAPVGGEGAIYEIVVDDNLVGELHAAL
jgi:hypothetical protein